MFDEFNGPDGELGTDADFIDDILTAREDNAERAFLEAEERAEHEAEIRDRMARDADTARGLGTSLGLDDMRHHSRMLDEAAIPSRAEMESYYAEEAARMREEYADILEAERLEWDA